ncbi:MAG: hypothetical protein HY247_02645 [archaeon]|nr:MAG: hypothetical protein HY247_02645 [archaeon]
MKVSLGTLKYKGEELVTFLEPRVGVKPSLSGDTLEMEDSGLRQGVRPRQVKTYLKRFLYMNGVRKNYRVFVTGTELKIQEIELGEKEEEGKKEEKEAKKEEPEAPGKEDSPAEDAPAEPEAKEPKSEKPKKAAPKKPKAKKKAEEEA